MERRSRRGGCQACRPDIRNAIPVGVDPAALIHGTRDFGVPFEQSVSMHERMRQARADVTLLPVVGGGHGNWSKAKWTEVRTALADWLAHRVPVK